MKTNAIDYTDYMTNNEKCYTFEAYVISKVKGYVWAKDSVEANELINQQQWTEIEEGKIVEVDEVLEITEEK